MAKKYNLGLVEGFGFKAVFNPDPGELPEEESTGEWDQPEQVVQGYSNMMFEGGEFPKFSGEVDE